MQCKNCGSHYRMRDLACPYCGTENSLGRIWMQQRTSAEIAYEKERIEAGKRWSPFIYNRAITRVIVVEIALFVLLFAAAGVFFGGRQIVNTLFSKRRVEEAVSQMNMLLEEERYGELRGIYNDYWEYLDDEDPQVERITQVADLVYRHDNFMNTKLSFFALTTEKKQEDTYMLNYLLRSAIDLYGYEPYSRFEMFDEAAKLREEYREEVRSFLIGYLKLTEEEYEELISIDYLYTEDADSWEKVVRERNGW